MAHVGLPLAPRAAAFEAALAQRILVLDGAMGTMIQRRGLTEADFRGQRWTDWPQDLKGANDLLVLTRPDVIAAIHRLYLEAGADLIETNSFNAQTVSLADYGLESIAYELNYESARLARQECEAMTARTPDKPRFVAGAVGPTNRTASLSPDVNDPGFRNVDFDALRVAYAEAIRGLIDGGADVLLIETVFDTLNCKAALFAADEAMEAAGLRLPVMVSGTITDRSGRTLSGQTAEAFWHSVRHAKPISIGLNCALGADLMRPHVADLARMADAAVSAYPNAGLPNQFGEYDESPDQTAAHLREWASSGLVNIVGGCCGTTPDHIAAIAKAVAGLPPRPVPTLPPRLTLAGLEPFALPAF